MSIVMDKYDTLEEEQNLRYFSFIFGLSQFFGALSVILIAIWMGTYDGGFGWQEKPQQEFHYHPLFMTIGMIFLYGEAILVYRVFRHERKAITKTAHVVMHSCVFVFFVVALKAVFDSHNLRSPPIPNMYSLHSWVGMATVLLFNFQFLFGFVSFYFPGFAMPVRQWYMPIHRYFGIAIFALATGSALMGITEKTHGHIPCGPEFCTESVLANFCGLCVALYAFTVIYLVVNPKFRRRPLPEEESHQQLIAD